MTLHQLLGSLIGAITAVGVAWLIYKARRNERANMVIARREMPLRFWALTTLACTMLLFAVARVTGVG